MSTGVEVTVV